MMIHVLISIYDLYHANQYLGRFLGYDVNNMNRALKIILLTYLFYRMINHNSLNRLDIAILINITLARNVSKDTIKRVIITSYNVINT